MFSSPNHIRMFRFSFQRLFSSFRDFDKTQNYFQIFKLTAEYDVDTDTLSQKYKSLQRIFHPDKHATSSKEDKDASAEYSSLVNKAYQTLVDPHKRGTYLLRLAGHEIKEDESEVQLNPDFLETMMEINESLAASNLSKDRLKEIHVQNDAKLTESYKRVSEAFASQDFTVAKQSLAELKFYKNIAERVKDLL
ncbi:Iron-sulfur cluster co-chaperone protein HscB [Halotydeus destructor]|nr:Iron-sulfur cluster co-chaperone protein HscB [Halotydeus destructor]